jgi:hypothetical protein
MFFEQKFYGLLEPIKIVFIYTRRILVAAADNIHWIRLHDQIEKSARIYRHRQRCSWHNVRGCATRQVSRTDRLQNPGGAKNAVS